MPEAEAQVIEQAETSAIDLARQAALSMIQREEGTAPAAKAQPETGAATTDDEPAAETTAEDTPQPERYKLTVKSEDGSDVEVEVDVEDLKKGFMLEKSYRQKTTQLARERESVAAEKTKAVQEARRELDAKLATAEAVIRETLAPELDGIDMDKLAEENPALWAVKFQKLQKINSKLTKIQQERQSIAEQQRTEANVALRKQAANAIETLQTKIPQWNDVLYGNILKAAVENYGYAPQEVGQITDPKAIEVLHDAMQFRALKAKPLVDKRVPAQPKPVLKAGSGESPNTKGGGVKDAMAKLTKSGRREDAVALMADLITKQGAGY